MRIREPKVTALIFAKGKVVITGAKSEQAAMKASKIFQKAIQKVLLSDNTSKDKTQCRALLPEQYTLSNFKIQNIVAVCDVGFSIKLEAMYEHDRTCHYEPELFPALIYKNKLPKVTLMIFTSGKIVFAGAKTREQID